MKIHINNIINISPRINILFINNFGLAYYEFYDYLNRYFEFRKEKKEKKTT
jgi:hypothetical protein